MKKLILLLMICWPIITLAQFQPYDVLITEWMADPSPVQGLPNAEFVEIYNATNDSISLLNWQLGDASSVTNIRTNYYLAPHSYLILCSNANVALFSNFGSTLGVTSFPNLNNNEDKIMLISPDGTIIHELNYSLKWYRDPFKIDGG